MQASSQISVSPPRRLLVGVLTSLPWYLFGTDLTDGVLIRTIIFSKFEET